MCHHCNRHFHIKPFQRPEDLGAFCYQCSKIICAKCAKTGRCDPLEKKLEAAFERSRRLKEYGAE